MLVKSSHWPPWVMKMAGIIAEPVMVLDLIFWFWGQALLQWKKPAENQSWKYSSFGGFEELTGPSGIVILGWIRIGFWSHLQERKFAFVDLWITRSVASQS